MEARVAKVVAVAAAIVGLAMAARFCGDPSPGAAPVRAALVQRESPIGSMKSWGPGPVCTCGYVQNVSMPTEQVLVGIVFVSELRRLPRDNEVANVAMCWWKAFVPARDHSIKRWDRVCVKGIYDAPSIAECQIVPSCDGD